MIKKLLIIATAFAAGVLLAPRSGRETRRELKSNLDHAIRKAKVK